MIPGNKSKMILLNNTRSFDKNLGTLTSLKAFNNNLSSTYSGYYYLSLPAAVITEKTALIP